MENLKIKIPGKNNGQISLKIRKINSSKNQWKWKLWMNLKTQKIVGKNTMQIAHLEKKNREKTVKRNYTKKMRLKIKTWRNNVEITSKWKIPHIMTSLHVPTGKVPEKITDAIEKCWNNPKTKYKNKKWISFVFYLYFCS